MVIPISSCRVAARLDRVGEYISLTIMDKCF